MSPRLVLLALLLSAGSACDWLRPAESPRYTEQAEVTSPWKELGVPAEGGTVTYSDGETVSVDHGTIGVRALATDYAALLEKGGFTLDRDDSAGGAINQTWLEGDRSVVLAVVPQEGRHVVSLSTLPF